MLDFFNYKKSNFKLTIDQQRLKWFKEFLKPFLVVTIVYATMYLVRNNFKAAQPFMKEELGFSTTYLGYISLGFSLSYGIGSSPLGYFFDGKNTKKIISSLLILSDFIIIAIRLLLKVEERSLSFLIVL